MSSETSHVTVYYFIPADGDKEEYPNAFKLRGSYTSLTIRQIKNAFPLPGTYYFRFKIRVGSSYAWMDPKHDDDIVPLYDDTIIAKVLRIHCDFRNKNNSRVSNKAQNQPILITAATSLAPPAPNTYCHIPTSIQQPPPSHPPPPRHPPPPPNISANGDLIDLNGEYSKWLPNVGYI